MWQWSPIRIWGTDMIEGKQDQGGKELTGIASCLPEQQVYVGWWEIIGPLLPPSSSSQLFVQTIWLGKEGVVPEGCEGELPDQGENSMLRVGKHTMLAAGCDFSLPSLLLHVCSPVQAQPHLPNEGIGRLLASCPLGYLLGEFFTCCYILSGTRDPFNILNYPEIQPHGPSACLDSTW